MRGAQNAAADAATTARNTAAGYGANASTIGSQLMPFLSRQMEHPAGYSQQDIGAMLTNAEAGAGGATAGLAGAASKRAATSRNPVGFSAALDAAARTRAQAAARASEGIAARNAGVKLAQQGEAARGLGQLYGMNLQGDLGAQRIVPEDINSEVNASKSGWLQNLEGIMRTAGQVAGGAGGMMSGLAAQGIYF